MRQPRFGGLQRPLTPIMTIPAVDWLARRASLTPDRVALVDTLHQERPIITYRAWNAQANRTAAFLRDALGVQPGDRVAMLALNCVEYLDLWFALGKLGAVLQNLNWRLTAAELQGIVQDAAPAVFIYGPEFRDVVADLRGLAPSVRHWVALGQPDRPGDQSFSQREACSGADLPEAGFDWEQPWVICYTGGTTGLPKGAILTHRAITANAVNTVVSWGLTADDVAILNAPLFHTGGLNVFTAPLVYIGGASIVCQGFDAGQVFDLVAEGAGGVAATLFFGVPTMFNALQQHPRWPTADFSRLKLVISGGAPCPLPVFERFWAKGVDFKSGYGLTEAGPNTFWLPGADVRRKPGAVGFPLFHVQVKLIRPDGQPCAAGEPGELLIRGPHVCAGYWNNPAASAAAIDADGWLHTGDLAICDEEGYYTIAGRSKDLIISGGENIYPAEIESVACGHPAVAAAALIGVPDPYWGEVGRLIVILADQDGRKDAAGAWNSEEFMTYLRGRLARYKVPKSVVVAPQLPLTGAGKVNKQALLALYGRD